MASGTRYRRPTGCGVDHRCGPLRGEFVLVKQTAESVVPTETPLVVKRLNEPHLRERRLLVERAVWPMRVVVDDVLAQDRLELPAGDDQDAVETFPPGAADPALRVRLRPWSRDRCPGDPESLRTEDLVEGGRELAVAVADQIRCLCFCSARVIVRLRACWMTQAPSGLPVMPARYTRRRASSMKKST
jgi:hypothetical protein